MHVFCFCDNMRDIYLATCPDESVREEMGIQRERDMRLGKQEEKRGGNGERPGSHGEKRVSNGEKRVSYGEKGVSYGEKRGDRCLVINSHWTSAAKAAPIEQVDSQHCFQPSSHDNRPVIGVTLASGHHHYHSDHHNSLFILALLLSAENSPPSECRGARNESERCILCIKYQPSASKQMVKMLGIVMVRGVRSWR